MDPQQALLDELSALAHTAHTQQVDFSSDLLDYKFQCAIPQVTEKMNAIWDSLKPVVRAARERLRSGEHKTELRSRMNQLQEEFETVTCLP